VVIRGEAPGADVPTLADSSAGGNYTTSVEGLFYPSPQDWRDEVVYSVLLDRFDYAGARHVEGDPKHGDSRHGGNLAGAARRLGYLADLGVTVLQLSPVSEAEPDCYHGYGPVHLLRVDHRLGTMADLVALVRQAHQLGIRVLLDLVLNHMGRVFDYDHDQRYRDEPAEQVRWRTVPGPSPLADKCRYSRRGIITDWKHPMQAVRGDFPPGYRRLATEDFDTGSLLINIAQWWVQTTDADGVRVDAVRHLDPGFVTRFCTQLKNWAASVGKNDLLVVGEYSSSTDQPLRETLDLGVDSVYLYPEYRRQSWAVHGQSAASELASSFQRAQQILGEDHGRSARFIDNHDVFRFLRDGEPVSLLRPALALLTLSIGIPQLYYGTEQGFRQATRRLDRECSADRAAPHNREDMFADGVFTSASSAGDQFDHTSVTFAWTRELLVARRTWVALRRGAQTVRFAHNDGPGLYAFSRHTDEQEVLVVLNTAGTARSASVPVGPLLERAGILTDALQPSEHFSAEQSDAGCVVHIAVDAHGVRVLVPPQDGPAS